MAKTGIKVDQGCVDLYNDMKIAQPAYDYATCKISNDKVVADSAPKKGSSEEQENAEGEPASFKALKDDLLNQPARFAFYNFAWTERDGFEKTSLTMINWLDDSKAQTISMRGLQSSQAMEGVPSK